MRLFAMTATFAAAFAAAVAGAPVALAQDVACAATAPAEAPTPPEWIAQARSLATGAGVRVAVVDTGVAPSPELDQVLPGADFVTPDSPDPLSDCDVHGTVVAGVIAGTTVGIAPDAEIVAIRQTSAHYRDAQAGAGNLATLGAAVDSALDAGARVINVSVVACVDPVEAARVDTSGLDAALARAEAEGAVVVSAAGNVAPDCPQGSTVFPAHSPTVLAVGARSDPYTVADYSVATPAGAFPISAGGRVDASPSVTGDGWASGVVGRQGEVVPFEGTSFAAPVVSGSVALLLQRYPGMTPGQVRERIAAAAQPHGGAIDPLVVATQLAPDRSEEAAPLVIEPARSAKSRARGRWLTVAGCGAVLLAAAWVAASLRRRPAA